MFKPFLSLSVLAIGVSFLPVSAHALDVQLKDLKDNRTTADFFKGLDVDITIKGPELAQAKAVRTRVTSAKDSTGKNLIDTSNVQNDFAQLYNFGSDTTEQTLTLKLLNPERKAESIQELKGEVELYIPDKDPSATVTLKGFKNNSGKPIADPALKSQGLEMALYTSAQYAEQKKKDQEKQIAEMRAQGVSEEIIKFSTDMMGGFMGGDDANAITVSLKDPNNRLIGIEFIKSDGTKVDSGGSMTSNNEKTLYFNEPVPDDATIVIRLLTDKAIAKAPLQLAALTLP